MKAMTLVLLGLITTLAIRVRRFSVSPANNHPSNTATTGFTKAYVPTFAALECFNSHIYAVNPTSEPKTIKYPSDKTDCVVTNFRSSRDHSPVTVPAMNSSTPPEVDCIPVIIIADLGNGACRE